MENFLSYALSDEFQKGVYVEIAGMIINIVLISVAVPIIIWGLNYKKRYQAKMITSFYVLQIHNKIAQVLLKMINIKDIPKELESLILENKLTEIHSHIFYGNTENLLDLLKIKLDSKLIPRIDRQIIKTQILEIEKIITEMDTYILLFNSMGTLDGSNTLFELRLLLYTLRDLTKDALLDNQEDIATNEYILLVKKIHESLGISFKKQKKFPDTMNKSQYWIHLLGLLLKIPFIIVYRRIIPVFFRLTKDSINLDPYGSNFFIIIVNKLLEIDYIKEGFDLAKIGISEKYFDYLRRGIKKPTQETKNLVLNHIKKLCAPEIWNKNLIEAVFTDFKKQNPNPATFDAVKANAVFLLSTLINQDVKDRDNFVMLMIKISLLDYYQFKQIDSVDFFMEDNPVTEGDIFHEITSHILKH